MINVTRYLYRREIKLETILTGLLLGGLSLLLILEMVFSLGWRMEHDTPNLHYVAFLIDRFDMAPYRDIFETNMPGVYLFHLTIGKLFGYGDLAFRWVDVIWLLALLAVTACILWRFGKRVAWAGAVLFGLSYLQFGPSMSLQRDYVGLLPAATAVLIALSSRLTNKKIAYFLVGFFFGLAAALKPHLALGLPVVLLFLLIENVQAANQPNRKTWLLLAFKITLLALAGFLIPLAVTLIWVWRQGVWADFVDLFSNYLPLYLQLDGQHQIVVGFARFSYLLRKYKTLGGFALWLTPAALGVYLVLFKANLGARSRRAAWMLAALTGVYSLYPIFSGQFFDYHWLPFLYFVVGLAALVLVPLSPSTAWAERLFPLFILIVTLFFMVQTAPNLRKQLLGKPPPPPKDGLVDEIAAALRAAGAEPGDAVQPLDWTGGTMQAMLLTEAKLATPFIYDYYFYHHPSEPVIQELRRQFMSALASEPPPFMIENEEKARVSGPGTTSEFPELRQFIAQNYEVVVSTEKFKIFARR